jgi:hypothetical protein
MYNVSEERVQCAKCGETAAMKDRMISIGANLCPNCCSESIVWADMERIIERTEEALESGEL